MFFVRINNSGTLISGSLTSETIVSLVPEAVLSIAAEKHRLDSRYKLAIYKVFSDGSDLLTVVMTNGITIEGGDRYLDKGQISCTASIGTKQLKRWLLNQDISVENAASISYAVQVLQMAN